MTDRPILFSAPMVRALLDGRKTQTRRLLPNPEYYGCPTGDCPHDRQDECNQAMRENTAADLRFAVGDRLWVKETWRAGASWNEQKPKLIQPRVPVDYIATPRAGGPEGKTRVSIFMPRWASRLTLTVSDVRVEMLNDCTSDDAIAEGIVWRPAPVDAWAGTDDPNWPMHTDPVRAYRGLWNTINGAGAWEANPWIVAVSFTVEQRNIDA